MMLAAAVRGGGGATAARRGFRAGRGAVQAKVGFIGLGNMGRGMVGNLAAAGHELVVHDVNGAVVSKVVGRLGDGVKVATPQEMAAAGDLDAIVTMLPTSANVRDVYAHKESGLLTVLPAQAKTLLLDCSTIDPLTAQKVQKQAKKSGLTMVDSPVSGGTLAAKAGTLTFMVGASTEAFAQAQPFLAAMGKNVVHCGAPGMGQVAKICNNMLLAISMMGVSEAMNMGVKLGMDAKVLAHIINISSGRCWSSDTYNPVPGILPDVPSSRDYQGGFIVDLMKKDLGLAMEAASAVKAPVMLGGSAHDLYTLMSNQGYGGRDFSSVYKFLSDTSKRGQE